MIKLYLNCNCGSYDSREVMIFVSQFKYIFPIPQRMTELFWLKKFLKRNVKSQSIIFIFHSFLSFIIFIDHTLVRCRINYKMRYILYLNYFFFLLTKISECQDKILYLTSFHRHFFFSYLPIHFYLLFK